MKKLIAIGLLTVYLFNLAGYALVFGYFIHRSETQLIAQLDNSQYRDQDLVEISLPLYSPYIQNTAGFERIDGTLEKDGIIYHYVKRRISNDTVHIMCIPDQGTTQLVKGRGQYNVNANDIPNNLKEKNLAKKAGISTECINAPACYAITSLLSEPVHVNEQYHVLLQPGTHAATERPPQVC